MCACALLLYYYIRIHIHVCIVYLLYYVWFGLVFDFLFCFSFLRELIAGNSREAAISQINMRAHHACMRCARVLRVYGRCWPLGKFTELRVSSALSVDAAFLLYPLNLSCCSARDCDVSDAVLMRLRRIPKPPPLRTPPPFPKRKPIFACLKLSKKQLANTFRRSNVCDNNKRAIAQNISNT